MESAEIRPRQHGAQLVQILHEPLGGKTLGGLAGGI